LGIVLAGVSMYLLAKEFFGELGGIVSGLFYLYAPYHAVDIYVRGDVAEFWAYAFIPLMLLGFYKKNILVGVIGFAGVILSHNLTAMMVAPLLLIIVLLNSYFSQQKRKFSILPRLLFIFILGLAISAFYWIPALAEIKNTNVFSQIGGGADFRDNFVCIGQLWDSLWGFGGSVAGCTDGLSFKIGKLHILAAVVVFIIVFCFKRVRKTREGGIIFISFLGFLISVFLMLEISKPIWDGISLMAFFQYPWRFLILASFFSSFLAGSLVFLARQFKIKLYFAAFPLIFLILFFNIKLFNPQTIIPVTAADFTNEIALKWTASKISDEFLPSNFKKPQNKNDVYNGKININVKNTPIEQISNIISLIGLLVLITGIILYKNKPRI
jgi:hypothetical protein